MAEVCNDCPCNCKPISAECVTRFSDIKDPSILEVSHWQKATDDIDDLIGIKCAEELCSALEVATQEVNDNEGSQISDFLDAKWLSIINNRHFKKWYANRLLFHWLYGASISELTASGLIVQSNNDDQYKNNFNQAVESERKRLEKAAQLYATEGRNKFLSEYWNKNTTLYDCIVLECGCTCSYKCDSHKKKNSGISADVV